MPSNKDLIKEAIELANALDIPILTEGLNNSKLSDLVSDLKAKKRDADLSTQADTAPAVEPAAEPAKVKKPPYYVKEGKALTTKRGVLSEGEEIKVEDVFGGKETLDKLVKGKYVGKG